MILARRQQMNGKSATEQATGTSSVPTPALVATLRVDVDGCAVQLQHRGPRDGRGPRYSSDRLEQPLAEEARHSGHPAAGSGTHDVYLLVRKRNSAQAATGDGIG